MYYHHASTNANVKDTRETKRVENDRIKLDSNLFVLNYAVFYVYPQAVAINNDGEKYWNQYLGSWLHK